MRSYKRFTTATKTILSTLCCLPRRTAAEHSQIYEPKHSISSSAESYVDAAPQTASIYVSQDADPDPSPLQHTGHRVQYVSHTESAPNSRVSAPIESDVTPYHPRQPLQYPELEFGNTVDKSSATTTETVNSLLIRASRARSAESLHKDLMQALTLHNATSKTTSIANYTSTLARITSHSGSCRTFRRLFDCLETDLHHRESRGETLSRDSCLNAAAQLERVMKRGKSKAEDLAQAETNLTYPSVSPFSADEEGVEMACALARLRNRMDDRELDDSRR